MRFKHSLPWIAGIAVVVVFMFSMGMEELKAAVKQIDPFIIVFLCFLQVLTLALGAYKWRYLLIKLGKRLSLGSVFAVYMAGNFIESITPSVKLGGEAAKVYLFRRRTSLTYPQLAGRFWHTSMSPFYPF